MSAQAHVLDNPAHASLAGPHAHLAERHGAALRYPVDVAPYAGLPEHAEPRDWADLATLTGHGALIRFAGAPDRVPEGWEVARHLRLQLVDASVRAAHCEEAIRLVAADVPDMLALVERTDPGPFLRRTVELGTYLGIRRNGALIAIAGERLHPPGWIEISAVCTHREYRGHGLAGQLVLALADDIRARGESAFLHVSADNHRAIGLYESLGFRRRRLTTFLEARVPPDVLSHRDRARPASGDPAPSPRVRPAGR
jgi:ribosomal protein S18 acetylase RimI-like enzyme